MMLLWDSHTVCGYISLSLGIHESIYTSTDSDTEGYNFTLSLIIIVNNAEIILLIIGHPNLIFQTLI